jgi:hypothetical protein
VYFTQHAVERFRQRWASGLSYARARYELVILSKTAVPLRERTQAGDLQFQVTDGAPIVFVCKREHREGHGALVCVTVLPEPEQPACEGDEPDPRD